MLSGVSAPKTEFTAASIAKVRSGSINDVIISGKGFSILHKKGAFAGVFRGKMVKNDERAVLFLDTCFAAW